MTPKRVDFHSAALREYKAPVVVLSVHFVLSCFVLILFVCLFVLFILGEGGHAVLHTFIECSVHHKYFFYAVSIIIK